MRKSTRFTRYALEELGLVGASTGTSSITQCQEQLYAAEELSVGQAALIGQSQQSALALEAMARGLKSPDALSMGKLGARYLNIAAEQFLSASRISMEELPLDVNQFVQAPQEAVAQAVTNLGAGTTEVIQVSAMDLATLLGSLVKKREALSDVMRLMHARLDELEEDLGELQKVNNVSAKAGTGVLDARQYRHIGYSPTGRIAKAGAVVGDVVQFLAEHTDLYKRLIDQPCEWVRQHKDNLIAASGFTLYRFNPVTYLISGAQFSHRQNGFAFFKGAELPGGMFVYCKTVEAACYGHEAVEALMGSEVFLSAEIAEKAPANFIASPEQLWVLSPFELAARAKELRAGLHRLSDWSQAAHAQFWKDAAFEEVIVSNLLKTAVSTSDERGVGSLSAAVVKLLNEASANVGSTVVAIYEDLLRYMEDSMRYHVPQHHDGVTP